MLLRLLSATAMLCASLSVCAASAGALQRLEDALPANLYTIEIIVFSRDAGGTESVEPLIEDPPRMWPQQLMQLTTQRATQRLRTASTPWSRELNGKHCFRDALAPLPDFMKIVLSQGYEAELLNDFNEVSSQVTLTPALSDNEKNPFFVAPVPAVGDPDFTNTTQDTSTNEAAGAPTDNALAKLDIATAEASVAPPTATALQQAESSFVSAVEEFTESFARDSWQWLNAERLALGPQRRNLAKAPELNVVFHGRWQQPVPARDAPQYIKLPLQRTGLLTSVGQLQGHVGVTLGRYLHVNTHLWLLPDPNSREYAVLQESRRMRSNELHYVDHPLMGVLIKITPIEPSITLLQSWENLQQAIDTATP